ncbi:MAG: enoyl-CoA hydratase-related protein [Syntrophales bacterium]|nr:enoyl-CoA hydratase-related protein [Syntrophales bacterium]
MTKMNYTCEDRIVRITFDDGKMNVMNWDFFSELNECLDQTLADGAGALIFTGRPGVFSAGLDLKLMVTLDLPEQLRFQKTFAETMLRVYRFPVPTISACRGHAIAGGAILSYACDRFMAADGPFMIQINEVVNKLLIPSWIQTICKSSIPPQFWKEALLHSRAYSPREAFNRGIIDDLVDEESKVMEAATTVALDLLKLDGRAYGLTKSIMRVEDSVRAMETFDRELLDFLLGR